MMSDRSDQAEVAVLAPENTIDLDPTYLENEDQTLPYQILTNDVGHIFATHTLSGSIALACTSRLFSHGLREAIQSQTAKQLLRSIMLGDCELAAKIIRSQPGLLFNRMHRSSSNMHNIKVDPIRAAFDAADIHMVSTLYRIIANEYPNHLNTFLEEGEATLEQNHLVKLHNAYHIYRQVMQQHYRNTKLPQGLLKGAWLNIGKAMRELPPWLLREVCRCRSDEKHEIDTDNIPTTAEAISISTRRIQSILPLLPNKGLGYDFTLLFLFGWKFAKVKDNNTAKILDTCNLDVSVDFKIFEDIYLQSKGMIKSMLESIRLSQERINLSSSLALTQ